MLGGFRLELRLELLTCFTVVPVQCLDRWSTIAQESWSGSRAGADSEAHGKGPPKPLRVLVLLLVHVS